MTHPTPSGPATSEPATAIEAAGGVVLERTTGSPRVLVVHRPAYDDWSLPKGHLDGGESPPDAAVREVLEETGVRARIVAPAGTTEYLLGTTHKRVHWFVMEPADAGLPPQDVDMEVDEVAWWTLGMAAERLTHVSDRVLLQRVVGSDA
jgi:8-oxo-(d)GTP phosphatase